MKKAFLCLFLVCAPLIAVPCVAQQGVLRGDGAPTSATNCAGSRFYIDSSTATLYVAGQGSPCVWVKMNDATVPASATVVGTNASRQFVNASSATLANNTTGTAASLSGTGGIWKPVGKIASSLYTSTLRSGSATIYTPAAPGEFLLCADVQIDVPPSAATNQSVQRTFTSDGHAYSGALTLGVSTQLDLTTTVTQWARASGCGMFWSDASAIAAELYLNGVSGTDLTLTQVGVVGAVTTYTGTVTGGDTNAFTGRTFIVTGFATSGNNATCVATGSSATTITCATTTQANETHAGTATMQPSYRWSATLYQAQ